MKYLTINSRFQHGRSQTQLKWQKKFDEKEITVFINNLNSVNVFILQTML